MPVRTYPRGHAQVKTRTHGIAPRFPQVKRVNTNQHQEQTPKNRIGQKVACTAARIMASQSSPHDFRQQYYPVLILESSQIKEAISNPHPKINKRKQQRTKAAQVLAARKVVKDPDETRLHDRHTLTPACLNVPIVVSPVNFLRSTAPKCARAVTGVPARTFLASPSRKAKPLAVRGRRPPPIRWRENVPFARRLPAGRTAPTYQ